MNEFVAILKKATVVILISSALLILGTVLNSDIVPWIWLTYFFVIIQHLLNLFGWLYDMPTLIKLIGYSYIVLGGYWIYRGTMMFLKLFNSPE